MGRKKKKTELKKRNAIPSFLAKGQDTHEEEIETPTFSGRTPDTSGAEPNWLKSGKYETTSKTGTAEYVTELPREVNAKLIEVLYHFRAQGLNDGQIILRGAVNKNCEMTPENAEATYSGVLKVAEEKFDSMERIFVSLKKNEEREGRQEEVSKTVSVINRNAFSDASKQGRINTRKLYGETITMDSNYWDYSEIRVY